MDETRKERSLNAAVVDEINALRGRYRITQAELAAAIGVTQTQMSARLRYDVPLTMDEVDAIARRLGVSPVDVVRAASEHRPTPAADPLSDADVWTALAASIGTPARSMAS